MKHGIRLPPEKRPAMALRALQIFDKARTRADALAMIAAEFDVSEPTARNLVGFGRYLKANAKAVLQ